MITGKEIIIHASKWKMTAIATACFFSLAIFILVLEIYREESGIIFVELLLVSSLGILLLSSIFLHAVRTLVMAEPAVIINDEGIYDNTTAFGVGMVRWEEIKEIYPCNPWLFHRCVCIVPQDIGLVLSRVSVAKRILFRIHMGFIRDVIFIRQNILAVSMEELLLQIGEYFEVNPQKFAR